MLEVHSSIPSLNGCGIYMIGPKQAVSHSGLNALDPIPATLPSLSQPASMASRGVPYDQLTKEEKTQAWFTDMEEPPQSGQLQHYSFFMGHPTRTVVKRNPPSG